MKQNTNKYDRLVAEEFMLNFTLLFTYNSGVKHTRQNHEN